MDNFLSYLKILCKEFSSPLIYLTALIIGATINVGMGYGMFSHLTPYIVPILVQVFSKATVNYKNMDADMLLSLPAQREDPAFVMDKTGKIIASVGKTTDFLKTNNVQSLHSIFDKEDADKVLKIYDGNQKCVDVNRDEFHSTLANKWYQITTKCDQSSSHLLVWLDEVTQQKELHQRLAIVRLFSSEIMNSVKEVTKANDLYERLSSMILQEGYEGVFILRKMESGEMSGIVFKNSVNELLKSELIEIPKSSHASILASRKSMQVVAHTKSEPETQEAFEKKYPLDSRVKDFLGFPVTNFINYHQSDISIIAFNKKGEVNNADLLMMETLLSTARSAIYLIDLSIANEEKFLQIITGLATASEYSDELTGKHILRVNEYSKLLAKHLGCDDEFIEYIGQVAALHDMGKVAIPDIIKLQRTLTEPEREQMQMHSVYGAQIVEHMTAQSTHKDARLIMARNISLHHHQQWNGKGYPGLIDSSGEEVEPTSKASDYYSGLRPLKGDEIPLEALIVSLADKYDALRSARQYKPSFSHEKTTSILSEDDRTGTLGEDVFGPEIFKVYLDIQEEFDAIFSSMNDSL